MPLLYRGAGIGSYWYLNDARTSGFRPHSPGATPSIQQIMTHIARGSVKSPYISFSRSFAVARAYGIVGSSGIATAMKPGYVYEIEISGDRSVVALDPVVEVAKSLPEPWGNRTYQHDGTQAFLLGVVDPQHMWSLGNEQHVLPPGSAGTPRTPYLSLELETLVRALRDAEILIYENVPASLVRNRYEVY